MAALHRGTIVIASGIRGIGVSIRITGLLGLVWVGLLLQSCATIRVGSDFDRAANFSGYHSFSWMAREHHGSRNPLVVQRARDAIQAELVRKGYVDVGESGTADFVVDFTIGARDRTDVQSFPEPYGGAYWTYPGWWGPYWGSSVDVRTYREGTLSIDVFDARSHRPVWHGWAKKELTSSDMEHSEAPIRAAVESVLSQFPPR